MRQSEIPELLRLVVDVLKYYRQDATPFLLNVWENACSGFDLEQVRAALMNHMGHPERGEFAPRISSIVRVIAGTGVDRAITAWGMVFQTMQRVGAWQDVLFRDPVIHAVINDMGGWPKVARTEDKELSYTQHRFMELYRSMSERGFDGYPRMLRGDRASDEEFERKGLPPPAPVMIGDPVECAEVYAKGGEPRAQITFLRAGVDPATLLRLPGGLSIKALPAQGQPAQTVQPKLPAPGGAT